MLLRLVPPHGGCAWKATPEICASRKPFSVVEPDIALFVVGDECVVAKRTQLDLHVNL